MRDLFTVYRAYKCEICLQCTEPISARFVCSVQPVSARFVYSVQILKVGYLFTVYRAYKCDISSAGLNKKFEKDLSLG